MKEKEDSSVLKKKRLRKIILFLIFVALNATVITMTAMSEFGNSENAAELSEVKFNWWLLVPATLCFVFALYVDVWKYRLMIRSMAKPGVFTKKNEDWKLARRTVILGRYYDNITPAAVGGQPFQIYNMRKSEKLTTGAATAVSMFGMISLQIAFIVIALVCFLFGGLARDNAALLTLAWLGLIFYAFWPVMVGIATFFPKLTTKIITFIVKVLAKLKIVKDRDDTVRRAEKAVREYAQSIKMILKERGLFAKTIIMSLVFNVLVAMIPWFVLTAFGGDVNFFSSIALTIAVMAAVYFVPTPGNSGAAEGTFYVVFSALSTGYVFWAMLVWRFFSYYIYIIMGLIVYLITQLEKRKGRHA